MMHVNQFQHVNNFLNLEVANDLRQFFGCVCGWMIGGNQRMETLNMRGTPIDCSFRFLFFFWWFCEWKICGRHAQCPEKSMQGIAPKMCDLTMDFFLRGMEPGRFAPGTCVQLSGRIRIPKIQPKKLTRGPSRCWAQMCTRCVLNLCDHHFVPQIGSTQWCTCTCSVLNPYDTHFVPYIGGIQWCTCTGSILSEMCDNHSVLHIGSIQWRMCTCSVFKLCDVHFVPHIELETPSDADAPDLPERKSVEASSGARVPALFSNCCATILHRTLEAPSCCHAPALCSKLCTAHWKHPVVHMHLMCLEKMCDIQFLPHINLPGVIRTGDP